MQNPMCSSRPCRSSSWPSARILALVLALVPALVFAVASATGCSGPTPGVSLLQRLAAQRAIRSEVVAAYDFSRPDVPGDLMALYAPTGPIISASGGRITTSRDSLRAGIQAFWTNVGRNMRNAHVDWTAMHIDVLAPGVAMMAATYRIPHRQPNGLPHVIGGAWTAVFVLRNGHWYVIEEHLSDDPFAS
jgi:calcium/calmodulin dependent protein kinase II association protein